MVFLIYFIIFRKIIYLDFNLIRFFYYFRKIIYFEFNLINFFIKFIYFDFNLIHFIFTGKIIYLDLNFFLKWLMIFFLKFLNHFSQLNESLIFV